MSSSSDDAEQRDDGTMFTAGDDLDFMADASVRRTHVGMRWTNVAIPQGATITKAYIEFAVDETGSSPTDLNFNTEAVNNAGTFTSSSNNISQRATSSATVSWNSVPAWNIVGSRHQTPDLSSIIQEVVNRPLY